MFSSLARRRRVRSASSPAAPPPTPVAPSVASTGMRATSSRPPVSLSITVWPRPDDAIRALDQIDVADEVGDPARIRLLVDLRRRARPAPAGRAFITPMRSAIVIASSWSWVTMTKVSPSLLLQLHQLELGLLAQLPVERRQRLVEQQHARPLDQRARQRHALALAAGKLMRLAARRSPSSWTSASISRDPRRRSRLAACRPA